VIVVIAGFGGLFVLRHTLLSRSEPRLDDAGPLQSYYEAINVSDRRRRLCLPHTADDLSLTPRLHRAIARQRGQNPLVTAERQPLEPGLKAKGK
jgi:hypothetical protein